MKNLVFTLFLFLSLSNSLFAQQTDPCKGALGDVKWSVLSPADFQKENGDCWILMDGRNVVSSKLGAYGFSKIPNGQGVFVRAMDMRKSGRRDPDRSFGTPVGHLQNDELKNHNHAPEGAGLVFLNGKNTYRGSDSSANELNLKYKKDLVPVGGSETRPVNICLYQYIRIN